jgi:hypothetical protein
MSKTEKTQLERFVKRLKHELTAELNEIKHQIKSKLREKEYRRLPELDCRRVVIEHIRDELIDEISKEVI